MKKTNTNTQHKNTFATAVTLLLAGLFTSTVSATNVHTVELEKIEPVKTINLMAEAQDNLHVSFENITLQGLTLETSTLSLTTKNLLAEKKSNAYTPKLQAMAKTVLIAE